MIYPIQANLFPILILIIVLLSLRKHKDLKSMNNTFYIVLVFLMIGALFVDMISVTVNGNEGLFNRFLNNFFNMLLYAIGVLITFYWVLYVDHHIFKNNTHRKKILPFLIVLVVINTILSLASMFENIYFNINQANIYERGPWFLLNFSINYAMMLYSVYLIVRYHKLMPKRDIIPMMMFPLLPVFGSIIQVMFFGVLLIWPLGALSLLIIFIFVQSRLINVDVLTELYNKREFNDYVMMVSKKEDLKKMIGGLIIDIDNFKKINDIHGHAKGDQILRDFSDILRKSFRRDDFISRIGGDEFAVMIDIESLDDFNKAIQRLHQQIEIYNQLKRHDFDLKVSVGSEIYDPTRYKNFEDFIINLDYQMYAKKNKHEANPQ